MNQRTDKEYWQLIWNNFKLGDRNAFDTIYNEYVDTLFAYGSRITENRTLLEDSVHDLFIDVYSYGKGLRKPESLEYYLFKSFKRIIYRKLKETRRFDRSEGLLDNFDLKFSIETNNKAQLEERLILLQNELQNLNAKKRELIFLKFNSALSYVEIGKLLGLKPDTVKKQVHRLLKHLREKMGEKIIGLFMMCYKT